MDYRLLVYRIKGRHKLVKRFRSYWKLCTWISKHIKEEDYNDYEIRKQRL